LANETKPARSMSAFISGVTSRKYTGEPRIIPSALLAHLLNAGIDKVITDDAFPVPVLKAFHAGRAAVDLFSADLDDLSPDPFILKFFENIPHQDGRVAILSRTPVDCKYFYHGISVASVSSRRSKRHRHTSQASSSGCPAWSGRAGRSQGNRAFPP